MGTFTRVERHVLNATERIRRDRKMMWKLRENVKLDEAFKLTEVALENLAAKIEDTTRV